MHFISLLFIHCTFQNSALYKKLSVFGENDSRGLSNFLWKFQKTRVFWKFAHISRTYNQINYRDIWFAKATIIFMMIAKVLFFDIFSEKDSHLNTVVVPQFSWRKKIVWSKFSQMSISALKRREIKVTMEFDILKMV